MTVIIDYGMGNIGSISNMLRKIGHSSVISSDVEVIVNATRLILPGVGAFDSGIMKLEELGLLEILNQKVIVEKTPILGICLGAQLMTQSSEEGLKNGLSWFNAETKKFDMAQFADKYPLPNMGWRQVQIVKKDSLFDNIDDDSWFYFVHTYYLSSNVDSEIAMKSTYGFDFAVALIKENILGVQFHPEKSHRFGMELLRNFINNY